MGRRPEHIWTNPCDPNRQHLCSCFREAQGESYTADHPPQQVKQHGLSLLYREESSLHTTTPPWLMPPAPPPPYQLVNNTGTCTANVTAATLTQALKDTCLTDSKGIFYTKRNTCPQRRTPDTQVTSTCHQDGAEPHMCVHRRDKCLCSLLQTASEAQ